MLRTSSEKCGLGGRWWWDRAEEWEGGRGGWIGDRRVVVEEDGVREGESGGGGAKWVMALCLDRHVDEAREAMLLTASYDATIKVCR